MGPRVQESCCIYRKRQYADHGPVSAVHDPVVRQESDTFCLYFDLKSDTNLQVGTGCVDLDTAPWLEFFMKFCLFLRHLSRSGGSLLDGTTPKCLRYLNCPSFRQERKRLLERVNPKLKTGGRDQPLFPLSGLLLKKVYVESLRSMYASAKTDEESFTAQSIQGRLSLMSSQELEVPSGATMLLYSECDLNNSP
ncbi:hypothetical protein HanRHA438_Chr13g0583501 [Helianthus annuus]|nr:hypothetical protein HanRHA438_Chr13g0583501 [Helianthus annuus]